MTKFLKFLSGYFVFYKSYLTKNKIEFLILIFPLILTFLVIVFYVWPTYQDIKMLNLNIQQKEQLLAKYIKEINSGAPNIAKVLAYKRKIFQAKTPNDILSFFQKKIERIPEISIVSFRFLENKSVVQELKIIRIYFRLEGDIKSFVELLKSIELEPRGVLIHSLRVYPRFYRGQNRLLIEIELEIPWIKT